MNKQQFYLSELNNLDHICQITGLSYGEVEDIVGRFDARSKRNGRLKGQIWIYPDKVQLRHHFTNKKLWEAKYMENL